MKLSWHRKTTRVGAAELRYYLKDMPADVTKETDIVEWWAGKFRISERSFWSNTIDRIMLTCI